jgi:hypothetical protein
MTTGLHPYVEVTTDDYGLAVRVGVDRIQQRPHLERTRGGAAGVLQMRRARNDRLPSEVHPDSNGNTGADALLAAIRERKPVRNLVEADHYGIVECQASGESVAVEAMPVAPARTGKPKRMRHGPEFEEFQAEAVCMPQTCREFGDGVTLAGSVAANVHLRQQGQVCAGSSEQGGRSFWIEAAFQVPCRDA